jgi:N-acetyltransferase
MSSILCAPVTLRGRHAALVPLQTSHAPALAQAVRDGELWKLWYTSIPAPERMQAEVERRLSLQAAGYMNIDAANRRLEIGSTWTAARMQRSAFNTECKLLLLTHAFEQIDCIAVEFRTHRFNSQSRRAIERLGAQLDGMLRSHQVAPNGTLRDTAVYSIVAAEWPTVKAHLQWQLERPR